MAKKKKQTLNPNLLIILAIAVLLFLSNKSQPEAKAGDSTTSSPSTTPPPAGGGGGGGVPPASGDSTPPPADDTQDSGSDPIDYGGLWGNLNIAICDDSDSHLDAGAYYETGTCYDTNTQTTQEDSCSGRRVTEWYCTDDNRCAAEVYNCEDYNSICYDGACVTKCEFLCGQLYQGSFGTCVSGGDAHSYCLSNFQGNIVDDDGACKAFTGREDSACCCN